jgi:hypothetical protein
MLTARTAHTFFMAFLPMFFFFGYPYKGRGWAYLLIVMTAHL